MALVFVFGSPFIWISYIIFSPSNLFGKRISELVGELTSLKDEIDDIYEKGLNAGAIGGKLLGAGGGGFIMFLTPPHLHSRVADELQLKEVPVDFEHLGSQMIYHDYQDQED